VARNFRRESGDRGRHGCSHFAHGRRIWEGSRHSGQQSGPVGSDSVRELFRRAVGPGGRYQSDGLRAHLPRVAAEDGGAGLGVGGQYRIGSGEAAGARSDGVWGLQSGAASCDQEPGERVRAEDSRERRLARTGLDAAVDSPRRDRRSARRSLWRPDTAYALQVHTGDKFNAGTDANVTFTLTGTLGSSSKTVDTSLIGSIRGKIPGRMEGNAWDFVTLQSLNLGTLQSITVQRDNEGNAPDWFLDRILVDSFRYGVSKQATFQRWIGTSPVTRPLV
jgi:hypothetical protein